MSGIPFGAAIWHRRPEETTRVRWMQHELEPRRKGLWGMLFALSAAALVGYLTLAALQGDYGLLSLFRIEAQETALEAELASLRADRETLANATRRLSSATLDLDLLDERARRVLGYARPDEIMIR